MVHPVEDEAAPHAKGLPHSTHAGGRWGAGRRPAAAVHGTMVEHQWRTAQWLSISGAITGAAPRQKAQLAVLPQTNSPSSQLLQRLLGK